TAPRWHLPAHHRTCHAWSTTSRSGIDRAAMRTLVAALVLATVSLVGAETRLAPDGASVGGTPQLVPHGDDAPGWSPAQRRCRARRPGWPADRTAPGDRPRLAAPPRRRTSPSYSCTRLAEPTRQSDRSRRS